MSSKGLVVQLRLAHWNREQRQVTENSFRMVGRAQQPIKNLKEKRTLWYKKNL